jgi:DNA modification methylase
MEKDPWDYAAKLTTVFDAVRRALHPSGTLWLNLGDSYTGDNHKWEWQGSSQKWSYDETGKMRYEGPLSRNRLGLGTPKGMRTKNLIGVPWLVAIALQNAGWELRNDIIWHKPNAMPDPAPDRLSRDHEYIFLMAASQRAYIDQAALAVDDKQGGKRLARTVWSIPTTPLRAAHFAPMPVELALRCIIGGTSDYGVCPECKAPWRKVYRKPSKGDAPRMVFGYVAGCKCGHTEAEPALVIDPFSGAGSTGIAALRSGRQYLGFELNPEYVTLSYDRAHSEIQTLSANQLPLFNPL